MGMTQEQLAAKVALRQRTISDVETSGAARLDTLLTMLHWIWNS
jgi:DNA-binding XRE family transcriptional regulator